MWKTVPVRDQRFRPRSNHRAKSTLTPQADAPDEVTSSPSPNPSLRDNEVNAIVKRVRRVARSLCDEKWVQSLLTHLLSALQEKVELLLSCSNPTPQRIVVHVLGLGIGSVCGDTASSVNAASLLQMGLLHAIVGALKAKICGFVRLALRRKQVRPTVEQLCDHASVSGGDVGATDVTSSAVDSSASAVLVECFDPVASEADKLICAKLGYQQSSENVCGAYVVPANSEEQATLLVAFMPHSSATLYHNVFAANWPTLKCNPQAAQVMQWMDEPQPPPQEESKQCLDLSRLHQLIVIGNYLRDYDLATRHQVEEYAFLILMPLLSIDRLFLPNSRSRKVDRGIDGISFADVEGAFSDLSLMHCSAQINESRAQDTLGRNKPPPRIIKGGADTL